jgi:hypothetical protein
MAALLSGLLRKGFYFVGWSLGRLGGVLGVVITGFDTPLGLERTLRSCCFRLNSPYFPNRPPIEKVYHMSVVRSNLIVLTGIS